MVCRFYNTPKAAAEIADMPGAFAHVALPTAVAASLAVSAQWVPSSAAAASLASDAAASWCCKSPKSGPLSFLVLTSLE